MTTFEALSPSKQVELCLSAGVLEYEGSDSFTRADNPAAMGTATSGQTWTSSLGTAGIVGNKGYFSAVTGASLGLAYIRCIANGDIQVTVSTFGAGTAGLGFRIKDGSNFWRFRGITASSNYSLSVRVNDVDTTIGTWATAPVDGDVLKVRCEGSSIKCYVNGVERITVTDATFETEQNAGIYANNTAARFDDWSASFVWTDITAYVFSDQGDDYWSWSRGRTHEFDQAEAGELTLNLNNSDRRFEPEYAAGAYYPWIIPMRRIRVTAVWSAVTYRRFTGYVERWPLAWNRLATDGKVTVTCVDQLAVLAYRVFTDYSALVQSYEPYVYHRMGGTAPAIVDSGPNHLAALVPVLGASGIMTPTAPGLLPAPAGDDGCFAASIGAYWQFPAGAGLSGTGDLSTTLLFTCPAAPGVAFNLVNVSGFVLRLTTGLKLQGTDSTNTITGATTLVAGTTYHAAFTRNGSTLTVWLNGVSDATGSFTPVALVGATGQIGNNVGDLTIDEVAAFGAALTQGQIVALANASGYGPAGMRTTLTAGQTAGQRVAAIADVAGLGPLNRSIEPGLRTVAADELTTTTSPRAMLELVRATEQGILFIDGADRLVFYDGDHTRDATSADTWGDQPGDLHFSELFEPSYDIDRIFNLVTITLQDNTSVVVGDITSQQSYQQRPLSVSTIHENIDDARNDASWLTYLSKDAHLRFDQMIVEGWTQGGIWDRVLARDVGDRITVRRQPPGGGAVLSREVIIEKVSESVGPDHWTVAWQLAPEPTVNPGVWILDGTDALETETVLARD